METNSHPEAVASTVKQGQYSPRKRKDTAPKVNPQLAIELFFQEMGRIEAYTKRIEDATSRKVQTGAAPDDGQLHDALPPLRTLCDTLMPSKMDAVIRQFLTIFAQWSTLAA